MIGLHHMSYSPAAQAQQQQLNGLKLTAAALSKQRKVADIERASGGRPKQAHLQEAASSTSAHLEHLLLRPAPAAEREFIKILPRTAEQIMSSVPRCNSGKSRKNPSNFGTLCHSQRQQQTSGTNYINYHQDQRAAGSVPAGASQQTDHSNQVLLIVQDDQHEAGGYPVIGRRLPDKSAAHAPWPAASGHLLESGAPVVGRRSRRQQQQQELMMSNREQGPEVGPATRKHFHLQLSETPEKSKVMKQSQRPAAGDSFASSSSCSSLVHWQTSCSSSLSTASSSWPLSSASLSSNNSSLAPPANVPAAGPSPRRLRVDHHQRHQQANAANYCTDTCCLGLAGSECQLACCQRLATGQATVEAAAAKRKKTTRRVVTKKGPPVKSRSMRDLASIEQRREASGSCGALVEPTCMVSVEQLSRQLSSQLALTSAPYEQHSMSFTCNCNSSSNSTSSWCQANCTANTAAKLLQQLNHRNHKHKQRQHSPPQPPPIPMKPQKYTLMTNQLPIPLAATRDQQQQQRRQPHRQLVSEHNLTSNRSSVSRTQQQQQQRQQVANSRRHFYHPNQVEEHQQQRDDPKANQVTQMYESLASELKAKLSDPTAAPILLPPKDYDTLSRRQGKLTGIELRRSTNPQLVGPALKSSFKAHEQRAAGHQSGHWPQTAPIWTQLAAQSASGSKNDEHADDDDDDDDSGHANKQPQRSRSNSSSGLGSISLAGSSSPNEPMNSPASRSPSTTSSSSSSHNYNGAGSGPPEQQQQQLSRGKGIENHNPSKVSDGILWNGRVEIPLKVNQSQRNGNTYLATKQIIY